MSYRCFTQSICSLSHRKNDWHIIMKKTKIVAMHLPQYHRIPENDMWWGEGFTEWTNVKRARPLFDGHLQPRIPLDNNYYDLSDTKTMIEQMKLASNYGIDAFCFYHYWFKNGKQLLEKPVNELLNMKSVPLSYMFCWANEPWTRTWDGSSGAKKILMKQEYGDKNDWKNHFRYLSKFFLQDEYLKIDGRPVICIYKPADIKDYCDYLDYWNELAYKSGFKNGLFIIHVYRGSVVFKNECYCDGVMDFEPFATRGRIGNKRLSNIGKKYIGNNGLEYEVIDYKKFGSYMVEHMYFRNANHYMGLFTGWDNSPRVGDNTRIIYDNNSPKEFGIILKELYKMSVEANNDFLFINAWNEWGEGTFLEPDEKYHYGYLEEIKRVKSLI